MHVKICISNQCRGSKFQNPTKDCRPQRSTALRGDIR